MSAEKNKALSIRWNERNGRAFVFEKRGSCPQKKKHSPEGLRCAASLRYFSSFSFRQSVARLILSRFAALDWFMFSSSITIRIMSRSISSSG